MVETALLSLVGATVVAAAAYDATTLTIPNWISLCLLALFALLALLGGMSASEAGIHVALGVAALIVGMGLFAAGVIGGGDAKLFAALALYMGLPWIAVYVFAVATAGGVLAGALIVLRHLPLEAVGARFGWMRHLLTRGGGIPYGVAIAAGALFVFPATRLFALVARGAM